jgi:hypothetical protein
LRKLTLKADVPTLPANGYLRTVINESCRHRLSENQHRKNTFTIWFYAAATQTLGVFNDLAAIEALQVFHVIAIQLTGKFG